MAAWTLGIAYSARNESQTIWALTICMGMLAGVSGCPIIAADFPGGPPPSGNVEREIDEADIVKVLDGYLYVANPYTGLRIVDVRTPAQPELKGRVALGGRAVELFAVEDVVYILTAADFLYCAGVTIGFEQGIFDPLVVPDFDGSRLWVVDVSDKDQPRVLSTLDIDGFVSSIRRVGGVIYAAGNGYFGEIGDEVGASPDSSDETEPVFSLASAFVTSIDVSDPSNAALVETEVFAGLSLDIHVRDNAMYVFGRDSAVFDTSIISYVDISDPNGTITVRDQFRVPGTIADRFSVDAYGDVVRIVTEEFIPAVFATVVAMYTYDVSDPDDIERVSRLLVVTDRSVRAVRMDGDRGYVVSSFFDSPLAVLDLSDPANPAIVGTLDLPSISTQLHPLGDRLLGVGFDTSEGVRLAMVLYDVSDPQNPSVLKQLIVGERLTFDTRSTATVDDESLRIVEGAGLVILPVSAFNRDTGLFEDSVLFVQMSERDLTERGTVSHLGPVRRADALDAFVWLLSDQALQMVDAGNLDDPSSVELFEFISEQDLLDGGFSGCVAAARANGTEIDLFLPSSCGVLGLISMILLVTGLAGLRLVRRRV